MNEMVVDVILSVCLCLAIMVVVVLLDYFCFKWDKLLQHLYFCISIIVYFWIEEYRTFFRVNYELGCDDERKVGSQL